VICDKANKKIYYNAEKLGVAGTAAAQKHASENDMEPVEMSSEDWHEANHSFSQHARTAQHGKKGDDTKGDDTSDTDEASKEDILERQRQTQRAEQQRKEEHEEQMRQKAIAELALVGIFIGESPLGELEQALEQERQKQRARVGQEKEIIHEAKELKKHEIKMDILTEAIDKAQIQKTVEQGQM
ncbi:MAG TPA: hypothetical protein VN457_05555, partial [Chlamydiales bacterium]|nr:hypothetical protein [Chlamydiales bacterium]